MRVDIETAEILTDLVKVEYYNGNGHVVQGRGYTYFTEETLQVGDDVIVPVRDTTGKARVCQVNVPEYEVAAFRDKVKTIPAGSRVTEKKALGIVRPIIEDKAILSGTFICTGNTIEGEDPFTELLTELELPPGTALIRVEPGKDPEVIKYIGMVMEATRKADAFIVDSHAQAKVATDNIKILATTRKEIEVLKKSWLAPLIEREQEIKQAFDMLLSPLAAAEQTYRQKGTEFMLKQEQIRKQQEEAAELQRQANEAAIKAAEISGESVIEYIPPPLVTAPEPIKTVRAAVGIGSLTKQRKWRYKSGLSMKQILEAMPQEYLMVNETKIGQAVRAKGSIVTDADFNGVIEIYEEAGMRVR